MERVCWRCGCRYDATGFMPEAPCLDCQEVEGDIYPLIWDKIHLKIGQRGVRVPEEIFNERVKQIQFYTVDKKFSAGEIGRRLGISERTVQRYRKHMSVPVPEREILLRGVMWRDARSRRAG